MFASGLYGGDLLQNLKLHLKRFASNYNPDIEWQAFIYLNKKPMPVWCQNCFIVSDAESEQNVVYLYNWKNVIVQTQVERQKALQEVIANYTTPSLLRSHLVNTLIPKNPSLWCFTGMAFLPPLPRLFESSETAGYT